MTYAVTKARSELLAFARDQIRHGSKSFAFASFFFSPRERAGAWLLYSWCRACDDRIDRAPDARSALRALQELESATLAAARGTPSTDPVFQGLAIVLKEFGIPEKYPLDLLRGMRMDVEGRRYETLEELEEYCYCVAGVVGLMMCHVMGLSDERALPHAVALGSAMQLTNICRDIDEDLKLGRVYVPTEFLKAAGLEDREVFASRAGRARWPLVTDRLLDVADARYATGIAGLKYLSFRAAMAVAIAGRVYRRIGVKVRRRRERAWDQRSYTHFSEKLWTAATAAVDVACRLSTRIWRRWRPVRIDRVWGQS